VGPGPDKAARRRRCVCLVPSPIFRAPALDRDRDAGRPAACPTCCSRRYGHRLAWARFGGSARASIGGGWTTARGAVTSDGDRRRAGAPGSGRAQGLAHLRPFSPAREDTSGCSRRALLVFVFARKEAAPCQRPRRRKSSGCRVRRVTSCRAWSPGCGPDRPSSRPGDPRRGKGASRRARRSRPPAPSATASAQARGPEKKGPEHCQPGAPPVQTQAHRHRPPRGALARDPPPSEVPTGGRPVAPETRSPAPVRRPRGARRDPARLSRSPPGPNAVFRGEMPRMTRRRPPSGSRPRRNGAAAGEKQGKDPDRRSQRIF
jgi:hypothetical protein